MIMKNPVSKLYSIQYLMVWALVMVPMLSHAKLPFVPFPDDVHINVVGEALVVNGLPIMAYEYHTQMSLNDIGEFYKSEWNNKADDADTDQAYLETILADWRVLSRLEKGHNITVQMREDGIKGRWVLVGVSPLPEFLKKNKKITKTYSIPRLGLAKIVSLVQSIDNGMLYETYWMESGDSIDTTVMRYKQYFQEKTYNIKNKRVVNDASHETKSALLMVDGKSESIRMDAMNIDGKTIMVTTRRIKK